MRLLKSLLLASTVALVGVSFFATSAYAKSAKKVEKKCKADGTECKKGDKDTGCKAENCAKSEPAPTE